VEVRKLTSKDLEGNLHRAADVLRKSLNASENYKLVLPLLFVKRLNDNFVEKAERLIKEEKLSKEESYENQRRHTFFVPKEAYYRKLQEASSDVGTKINDIFRILEHANPALEGELVNAEFANTDKYTDEGLRKIISIFAEDNYADSNLENEDVFGDAYEFLLEEYAGETKKKGGQFYTPRQVVRLMVNIVKPKPGMRICDPTCGSGGMLIQSRKYLETNHPKSEPEDLTLEGQESNPDTVNLCKMNLVVHGITDFDIQHGDVLEKPKLLEDGKLRKYDLVLANFPFSEDWESTGKENDEFNRFVYGIPPTKNKADFAFIQHMVACLNDNGRACIVSSQGVLFREYEEQKIRKTMILGDEENRIQGDIIEAVIALPDAIFFGTPIPGCILLLNKNKPKERKNKILFYYAAHKEDYFEQPKRNILREEDIERIVTAIENYKNIKKRCHIANLDEIQENDYDLSVLRYVNIFSENEAVDILKNIHMFEKKHDDVQTSLSMFRNRIQNKEIDFDKSDSKTVKVKPRYFKIKIKSGWKIKPLKELLSILKDGTHNPPPKQDYGIPMLSAEDIRNGIIDFDNSPDFITEEDYERMHRTYEIQKNDVLLTIVGTLGRSAIVDTSRKFTLQRSVAILRTNEKILPQYLYYFFQTKYFQNQLIARAHTTVRAGVYLGELGSIPIAYPEEIITQDKICKTVSEIEKIINENKRLTEESITLQQQLIQKLISNE